MSDDSDSRDGIDLVWRHRHDGFATEVPWTDEAGHDWTVRVRLAVINGRLQPVEMNVQPVGEPAGRWVTGTTLRQLPVARIVEQARHAELDDSATAVEVKPTRRSGRPQIVIMERRGPGRPRVHDEAFFVEIAREHRDATLITSAPTQALAKKYGVSRGAVQKWLQACRQLKLLPPP